MDLCPRDQSVSVGTFLNLEMKSDIRKLINLVSKRNHFSTAAEIRRALLPRSMIHMGSQFLQTTLADSGPVWTAQLKRVGISIRPWLLSLWSPRFGRDSCPYNVAQFLMSQLHTTSGRPHVQEVACHTYSRILTLGTSTVTTLSIDRYLSMI